MLTPMRMHRVTDGLRVAGAGVRGITRSGMVRPYSPRVALAIAADIKRWGTSPSMGFALGATRHPDQPGVIDVDDPDCPVMSFAEIDHRCDMLALSLLDRGIGPGSRVGLLGRNSRAFLEALISVSRTGADLVYLNTSASPDVLRSVIATEKLHLLIHDREFAGVPPQGLPTITTDDKSGLPLLASLPTRRRLAPPPSAGEHIILTSGTSGAKPRGAGRSSAPIDAAAALLDTFPVKMRGTHLFAAPMFHSWGWMHHRLAAALDATHVLARRPDAARILELIDEYQVDTLVTVPVILRRLVELPRHVRRRYDLSSLRCVAVSGSSLPGSLATNFMDAYGDVLYNLYGSTEAAFVTCARPGDLRADPATAGKPIPGVHVEILDRNGRKLRRGVDGRVHVGSRTTFTGYTDGTDRERVRGLVFTGDIGRIDDAGRLTIVGRSDDVVITGGENVHPAEVEEVLRQNPDIADVSVTGTPDSVYGAVLVAHVVPRTREGADSEAILYWARKHLGPHHRPRSVVFHAALPRNATGKVLRYVLTGGPAQLDPNEDEIG